MSSKGRKLMKCDKCENEVEVAVEAKSCICSRCLMGHLSLSGMKKAREDNKEKIKAKKNDKSSSEEVINNENGVSSKKRGRPKKN